MVLLRVLAITYPLVAVVNRAANRARGYAELCVEARVWIAIEYLVVCGVLTIACKPKREKRR